MSGAIFRARTFFDVTRRGHVRPDADEISRILRLLRFLLFQNEATSYHRPRNQVADMERRRNGAFWRFLAHSQRASSPILILRKGL